MEDDDLHVLPVEHIDELFTVRCLRFGVEPCHQLGALCSQLRRIRPKDSQRLVQMAKFGDREDTYEEEPHDAARFYICLIGLRVSNVLLSKHTCQFGVQATRFVSLWILLHVFCAVYCVY